MIGAHDDDGDPVVIVCQGPPVCTLKGEAAKQAMADDCPWCMRIVVHADGTETTADPFEKQH